MTGVFGYSDEDGTEAASYDDKLDEDEIRARAEHVERLVEELTAPARRGADRRGGRGAGRVASTDGDVEGRAAHQGPEVDGSTSSSAPGRVVGDLVRAAVVGTEGVDLVREGGRDDRGRGRPAPATGTCPTR